MWNVDPSGGDGGGGGGALGLCRINRMIPKTYIYLPTVRKPKVYTGLYCPVREKEKKKEKTLKSDDGTVSYSPTVSGEEAKECPRLPVTPVNASRASAAASKACHDGRPCSDGQTTASMRNLLSQHGQPPCTNQRTAGVAGPCWRQSRRLLPDRLAES